MAIGFQDHTNYSETEDVGSVSISFGILSGVLGVNVDVIASTRDDSAVCKCMSI